MSAVAHVEPEVRDRTIASLAECVAVETRLLNQLADTLREQREGVACNDVQRVDDSVHAAHRIMQTLGEARRRRHALVHLLTTRDEVPLPALGDVLGDVMTVELRERQEELESLARVVSREVAMNRVLLTRAIDSGNDYVRRLVAPAASGTYGGRGEWNQAARAPALINRTV